MSQNLAKQVSYAEALDHNRRGRKEAEKAPALHHLEISEAENKGHIVEHHFEHNDGPYQEPKQHVLEPPEGPKPQLPEGHVLQHIAKHMGIAHEIMKGDSDEEETREEQVHKDYPRGRKGSANPAAE